MKILCLLLMLFLTTACWADALDTIILQTTSTDPSIRMAGFEALVPYLSQNPVDPRAIGGVTALLVLESSKAAAADEDADYYSDLIQAVAKLSVPTTIPALVGVIGSGNLVPNALARFGSQALEPTIARASDSDWIVRKCVMITLAQMLQPDNFPGVNDPASLKQITTTLGQGALDPNPFVASSARYALQFVPVSDIPVVIAGPNQTVECIDHHGTQITLNGSASTDPSGGVLSYIWKNTAGTVIGNSAVVKQTLRVGTFDFTLTVTNTAGLSATGTTTIAVVDRTPPTISKLRATPLVLHRRHDKWVPVIVSYFAEDRCSAKVSCNLSVTSDDPKGRQPQWKILDDHVVLLRSESSHRRHDRIYTISTTCTDASANGATASLHIAVHESPGDDDGEY